MVQSVPHLLISCTKTEHSAISVLTHSCILFSLSFTFLLYKSHFLKTEHYNDVCTYVHGVYMSAGCGFPSVVRFPVHASAAQI